MVDYINMTNRDFSSLAVYSVRYCLDRHSYAPIDVQDIIKRNIDSLTENDRAVMIRDISEHLSELPENESYIFKIDSDSWREFRDWLCAKSQSVV